MRAMMSSTENARRDGTEGDTGHTVTRAGASVADGPGWPARGGWDDPPR